MFPQVMMNAVEESAVARFTALTPPSTPNACCLQTIAAEGPAELVTLQDVIVSGNAESTLVQRDYGTETNKNVLPSITTMQRVFTLSSGGYFAYFRWC